MSMFSRQRDGLLEVAKRLDDRKLAAMIRHAANSILVLDKENERLREYVSAIAPVAYNGQLSCTNGVYECKFFNQCYNNEPTKHEGRGCKWVIWARELGIEVGHD